MTRVLPVLLAAACAPPVELVGQITRGPDDTSPLSGATIELRDAAFGLVDEVVADADGRFAITAPAKEEIHLVVRGDDSLPVAFGGESGRVSPFEIPDGTLWGFSEAEAQRWRDDFAGCPGADGDGTLLVGVTRLDVGAADPRDNPVEQYGFARVQPSETPDVVTREACYLGEEGVSWDPEANVTGISGRFALFGVEGGPWTLTGGRYSSGGTLLSRATVYVPEGGVVARLPFLVPL